MGQIGNIPQMLNSFGFVEDELQPPGMTKDNFDGGGLMDALSPGAVTAGERLPSMHQIAEAMSHHSRYLDVFLRMHNHVLKGDGPLSYELRHFVAMMAASRHQCSYLYRMEVAEFLAAGGDSRWLNFEDAPDKLKALGELNKIMAHRPWLLNKQMIKDLVSRTGKDNSRSWCLTELLHAIVILSHFHSLSSFVYATGIEESECRVHTKDSELSKDVPVKDGVAAKAAPRGDDEQKVILERVKYLVDQMKSLEKGGSSWTDDPEERNQCFIASVLEAEESQSPSSGAAVTPRARVPAGNPGGSGKTTPKNGTSRHTSPPGSPGVPHTSKAGSEILKKFTIDPDFGYVDFVSRYQPAACPTLRIQDCSWEDQGFSLLSRLYSETSSVVLDNKHRTAYNLTYNTLSTIPNVDTSKFRRAVWNYILCLYGIRHDDYNYQEVNQLLRRDLKTFIKRASCYPERLSGSDLREAMKELQYSEKVHVLLMVMEARMEAELLYALRAVMQHLT